MTAPSFIASFRRVDKHTLFGTVGIEVPSWRLKFKSCLSHKKSEAEWIDFPARKWINKQGDRQFADLAEIPDRDVRDRFQHTALTAVHGFDGGER
ncbi:MAG: hypothetical protein WB611_04135 [Stellaceae bacterium]